MSEEKPNEEEKPVGENNAQEANDKISMAIAAAIRIEAANKELKGLLEKQENMRVEDTLGGNTQAGIKTEKKDPDDEAARKLLKGTGYEDMEFK